jgi:hypothetical protein
LVAYTYECDDGKIGPTPCALIGGRLGGRWNRGWVCRTLLAEPGEFETK